VSVDWSYYTGATALATPLASAPSLLTAMLWSRCWSKQLTIFLVCDSLVLLEYVIGLLVLQ
jgi:hypothetical protein